MIRFIVPGFNFSANCSALYHGFAEQTNTQFSVHIVDDMSTDKSYEAMAPCIENLCSQFGIYATLVQNTEKKYALRNIIETAQQVCQSGDIVAVVDADDALCNPETVNILYAAYESGHEIVWTAHRWDINGMNISKELPKVDPYQWVWCSSHLRTFKFDLLGSIPESNFKDHRGLWMTRGYDQALMLPLLHVAQSWKYVPDVCYQYNIDSSSIPKESRNWEEQVQLSTINFVRARGFVNE